MDAMDVWHLYGLSHCGKSNMAGQREGVLARGKRQLGVQIN